MIAVVLVEPKSPGNIGAVARVMKNFGFKDLILVNPQCDHLADEALGRAMHAKPLLKRAKVTTASYLKKFDMLIATTSKLGSDFNIPRVPISPQHLAERLRDVKPKNKVAVLFGREDNGLHTSEILECDLTVYIPTAKNYHALNLSHSVAIVLYELFKQQQIGKKQQYVLMSAKEKEVLLDKIDNLLEDMHFSTQQKRETQRRIWKRIIGKAMPTKREAFALLGFFRKLE
ncbi:RNA methyltransferase [Candidatus Woesearchaeota archaeon]|nr:RNA methyltransferase [Candidatus Woesearchaeota archaeon]